MRHEDLREGTRRAAAKSERKLETRLAPGEKSNRKRMFVVALDLGPLLLIKAPPWCVVTRQRESPREGNRSKSHAARL